MAKKILVGILVFCNFPDFSSSRILSTLEKSHSNIILRGAERKHCFRRCGIRCKVRGAELGIYTHVLLNAGELGP